MNEISIREIQKQLVNSSDRECAYFSIDEYNEDLFIKANKDGLKLFAAELLIASTVDNDSNTWGINPSEEWIDDESLPIAYIKVVEENRPEILNSGTDEAKTGWFSSIILWIIGSLLVLSVILGFAQIVQNVLEFLF